MKSVLAVLVGYMIFAVSVIALFQVAGVDPTQEATLTFRIISMIYGVFFALAGGYVAGWIAGTKEIAHASAVACVLAAIATVSIVAQSGHALWSQIAALGFMVPAAVFGGVIRAWYLKKQG